MRELEIAVALQGESKRGRPKYAGRTGDGEVVVFYSTEVLREPVHLTLVPLEYLLLQRNRKNRK